MLDFSNFDIHALPFVNTIDGHHCQIWRTLMNTSMDAGLEGVGVGAAAGEAAASALNIKYSE